MNERWTEVAQRMVDALGVQPGEAIQVRDRAGRYDVVQEVLLAVEGRGATPLVEVLPPDYLDRLLMSTDPALLSRWDRHRLGTIERSDRALVLVGLESDIASAPAAALQAWQEAVHRLVLSEESRLRPQLVAAVPTTARAERLEMSLAALEEIVVPALLAAPDELQREVDRVLGVLQSGHTLTIQSGGVHTLHLDQGDRRWLNDTGRMPAPDEMRPGVQVVMNLPAGAVYTTVLETATHGSLYLPRAGEAHKVVLHFDGGRVVSVEAAHGADTLNAMFDRHTGEPRRVSHIGIGLNPYLQRPMDWVLVDEHRHGNLLIALGENRYLGGQNESSLNVDFAIPDATLLADGRVVVTEGQLAA